MISSPLHDMKKFYRLIACLIAFNMICVFVSAQTRQLYNITADSTLFPKFIDNLEVQTEYHFYYNDRQLDSLYVTIHAKEKTLEEILDQIFTNSGYRYSIDPRNYVFITKGAPILTSLPQGFFNNTMSATDSAR